MGLNLEDIKLGFNPIFVVQFKDWKLGLESKLSEEIQEEVVSCVKKLISDKEYKDLVNNSEEGRIEFAKDFLRKEGLIEEDDEEWLD